jgi:hypothetical protein
MSKARLTKQVSAMSCSGFLLSQEDASNAFIAVAFHLHDQAPTARFRRENPSPQFQNLVFTAVHTLLEHTGHPGLGKWVTLKKRNCPVSFKNVFKQNLGALVNVDGGQLHPKDCSNESKCYQGGA